MSKLQKILVRARRQVFSEMVGNNPSIFQGEGYDFIELREYMPGDDIRHIDWNITAKMQKPFIKIFREERELSVVVVSVLNGSVHFGSKRFKQEAIAEVAALLGFSTLKNGDLLSSYIFTDEMVSHAKPSKKLHQIQKNVQDILEFDAINKKVDFKVIADTLFKRLKRKSLILIIGDYFEIPDFRLLARKHEVLSVIVRDHLEEHPPEMGFASLIDPESGAVLEGDFNASSVRLYSQKVAAHDHRLFDRLRRDGIRFTKVYTDSIAGVKLRRLFEGR
ncbi:MAG: DUF58 domain-containing protein [Sulfurimonas sp.]|uniref:DUF58 domain-containing protein n=1 Tax=Sulfurimonas sp. TaxID=2022749 RepID=UPI0028CD65FA|nr:DUF58 domain-containing protein [Sulfurimonas sp.]MDT8338386.1 DUF58 domain-containing protein [Sulfurimonas sp.]